MARDYDPGVGRYVEADPIGLSGGGNLYTYVLDDPIESVDRSGLLTLKPSCKRFQTAIQAAERAVRANVGKCWQCGRDGTSSCINCKYRQDFLSLLASSEVECEPSTNLRGYCGSGNLGFPGITLTAILNPASTCARGGCIAETIVHELMHNIGMDHPRDEYEFDWEQPRCTGALCGK